MIEAGQDVPGGGGVSDDAQARAVRRAHLAYSDKLVAAIRAGVSTETLLSWGIPWADINGVLYAKGRMWSGSGAEPLTATGSIEHEFF